MGRWAQRRRGSGGGGSSAAPILITSVVLDGPTHTLATFSAEIDVADFTAANFSSSPSGAGGAALAQAAGNVLEIEWDSAATGDTDLTYSGTAPNVATPQTVAY